MPVINVIAQDHKPIKVIRKVRMGYVYLRTYFSCDSTIKIDIDHVGDYRRQRNQYWGLYGSYKKELTLSFNFGWN